MSVSNWILIVMVFCSFGLRGQEIVDSTTLKNYILTHSEEFGVSKEILNDPKYRLQIVYSQIDTTLDDNPVRTIEFGTHQYYYPASLVKFPLALLTLEKLSEEGLTLDDILVLNNDFECGNNLFVERSQRKTITFREMIENMMIISDNNYYSSLYHFLTPEYINEKLRYKGWKNTHIYKSFAGCEREDQLKCNSLDVINPEGDILYSQFFSEMDSAEMLMYYPRTEDRWFGSKHENKHRKIVPGPYDLNNSLEMPLNEVHEMLVALLRQDDMYYFGAWQGGAIQNRFLIETMKKFPRELDGIHSSKSLIPEDDEYKYAIIADDVHGKHPTKTTSKLGLSYGFTSEIAHVKNEKDGVEFFLSVSLYTNANDIVNDGDYEYKSVAKPFIASLSALLYAYELEKVNN